jgi:hypothetical protein
MIANAQKLTILTDPLPVGIRWYSGYDRQDFLKVYTIWIAALAA